MPGQPEAVAGEAASGARWSLAHAPIEALLAALASTPDGLSGAEAARRLGVYGPNQPAPRQRGAGVVALLSFFVNPLVLILLLSAGVSAFLHDVAGAAIIVVIVLLSVVVNFLQSYRSQRAADRLREEVAPTATALRDGHWGEVARRTLVPGDVIRLSTGDQVPADARLLESHDLHVQQAALTGESAPAEKQAVAQPGPQAELAGAEHLVFLGTSVVAGTATALVLATGRATAFGDIAASLRERPPETEFERGLAGFAQLIMRTVVFLVLFTLLASVVLGRNPLESLLFAVALAVGLTPEFLPMITTVTLAQGAVRMARRRVIVKHLAAIEDFGSMNVLLSDKTGTLTTAQTVLEAALRPDGAAGPEPLRLARLNSRFQTGLRSPLDEAILAQPDADADAGWCKVDEVPFDFERRRLSVVVEDARRRLLVVKGAPESVLAVCRHCDSGAGVYELDAAAQARALELVEAAGNRGARVLALAWREVPLQARYGAADETGLVLAGFLVFADPVIAGVAETLRALRRDGLHLKILSGDNERVVRHVCAEVGLDVHRLVLGAQLEPLGDLALGVLAERTTVFARVSPAQKHRIVLALKRRGHVVGFLGDGINDAPSLHAADVGISVMNAVDVAKDSADIILHERDLRVLHEGVIEGRKAFANVMKYLLMGTSSNFGNMFSMAGGVLFLPFLPMLSMQILLNNFLYDLAQVTIPTDNVDAAWVRRPQRWNVRQIRNFMLLVGPISSLYDFLTFWVLLRLFDASEALFHTGWFVESLATQTLVLFVIRTADVPWRSRPSLPLVLTTLAVVAFGCLLPATPLAPLLGFVPLPGRFFVFLLVATLTYLALVEWAKRRVSTLLRR